MKTNVRYYRHNGRYLKESVGTGAVIATSNPACFAPAFEPTAARLDRLPVGAVLIETNTDTFPLTAGPAAAEAGAALLGAGEE